MTLNNLQLALLLNNRQLLDRIEMLKNAINSITGADIIALKNELDLINSMLEKAKEDIENISSETITALVQRLDDIDETIDYLIQEIENNYKTLDDKIDNNDTNINKKVNDLDTTINQKIDDLDVTINQKVDNLDTVLNKKINDTTNSISENIDNTKSFILKEIENVDTDINKKIDDINTAINDKIDTESLSLNNSITDLSDIVTENTNNLNTLIQENYDTLDKKNDDTSLELNEKIETLNKTLDDKVGSTNDELKKLIETNKQDNNIIHENINADILKLTEDLSALSQSSTLLIEAVEAALKAHTDNTVIHVTQDDKDLWNVSLENAKDYAKQLFDGVTSFNIEIVEVLPTEDIKTMTIYFIRNIHDNESDYYEEYMYINNNWEIIGSTFVNLSPYLLKVDFDSVIAEYLKDADFQIAISSYLTKEDFEKTINDYVLSNDLDERILDLESKMHNHDNKTVLDNLSENTNGELLYNGNLMGSKISESENNAIKANTDGLFVEDKTQELEDLKAKTDSISIAQNTINVDLEYGMVTSTNAYNFSIDSIVPFDNPWAMHGLIFDKSTYSFILKPNKKYEIEAFARRFITNVSAAYVRIYNVTKNEWVGPSGCSETGTSNGRNVCTSLKAIIVTGDTEEQIQVRTFRSSRETVDDALQATWIVKEIGRVVELDPLEYANSVSGIEDTPVGHILTHMGTVAPMHYLICDGTEYNINDYPNLAQHIYDNFGTYNHFGGDGLITFAVPDLRAEFLRGAGEATRTTGIGGVVGEHQDPTYFPHIYNYYNGTKVYDVSISNANASNNTINYDVMYYGNTNCSDSSIAGSDNRIEIIGGTSRPTNTSVLYCIKYEPTYFIALQKTSSQEEVDLIQEEVTEIKAQNTLISEQNTLLQTQIDDISTLLDSINKVVV